MDFPRGPTLLFSLTFEATHAAMKKRFSCCPETTATAHLLAPAERGHAMMIMTGTGQTDLTTPDKPQGGTKTAATGALAVEKNPSQKNVPTMTGATAGANAAKRSREAPLPPETG